MQQQTYFVHRDSGAANRQSEGVEFAKIPKFGDGRMYFVCGHHQSYWTDIADAGNDDGRTLPSGAVTEPVTLPEIINHGLADYVDGAIQYGSGGTITSIYFPTADTST